MQNLSYDSVRPRQEVRRNCYADLFSGFKIYHQLQFCWQFNRQIGGLCAFQDFISIYRGATIRIGAAVRIGHEAAGFDKLQVCIHRWQPVLGRKLDYTRPYSAQDRTRIREYGPGASFQDRMSNTGKVIRTAYFQRLKLQMQRVCRNLCCFQSDSGVRGRTPKQRNVGNAWNRLLQKFKPFTAQIWRED